MGASYPESTNPQFGAGLSADAGSWGYPTHFNKEISDVSKSLFMWGPPNIFNWRARQNFARNYLFIPQQELVIK